MVHLLKDSSGHVSAHVVKVAIHTLGCCSLQALTNKVMSHFLLLLQEMTNMLSGVIFVLFMCTPKKFIKELIQWKWNGALKNSGNGLAGKRIRQSKLSTTGGGGGGLSNTVILGLVSIKNINIFWT